MRTLESTFPRPVLRLLRRKEVLRIDLSVVGDRTSTFPARRMVRNGRDGSKKGPKARNPGLAGTRSQQLTRLPGAIAVLESAANGIGMTANLPGLAAAATRTGIKLGASPHPTN